MLTLERDTYRRTDRRGKGIQPRKGPREKEIVKQLFAEADVTVNGDRPWDIRVRNDNFFRRGPIKCAIG